ncbi:iron-containing redox enzyme family protein [Kineococcus gynurae]|uniref:Iron-containing redox enzyme family protein n=1 Tax=Kineococcus gynurae TaxID=452979 RepID=A0ABV5LRT4_9ACTN
MSLSTLSRGPVGPARPADRGPISAAVLAYLREPDPDALRRLGVDDLADAGTDPFGEDLHLALYVAYELHYRGFADVPADLEWDPELIRLRRDLEEIFLAGLRARVPGGADVDAALAALLQESGEEGISHHLARRASIEQFREYVALRSIYHLKEADPQAWVIPRLEGAAKAALVTVEHDEYGAGRPERMHAHLFAEMMRELGLDAGYGAHLDRAPGAVLAEVNLMSLCGLRRSLRGALVGQFAVVELTSSPGSARLVRAAERLGCGPASVEFYAEHVEADAVHEQLVRHALIAPLVRAEPALAADVVFGVQAATVLDADVGAAVLDAWREGRSALRALSPAPHP